jgi:protein ImuA
MKAAILQNLAQRIAEIQQQEHPTRRQTSLAGMPAWEDILLGGKLSAGALVELLAAEEGTGGWTLAFFMARHACGQGKVLVVADSEKCFYPPAARQLKIDLERTLVIRPRQERQTLTALTQSLRCPAVGAALGKLEQLSSADCRRLQVAAENGGGVGFLLRPAAAVSMPSFATARLLITPLVDSASAGSARRIQIEALKYRGGSMPRDRLGRCPLILEIDDEKGHVCVPTSMAAAKFSPAAARASG